LANLGLVQHQLGDYKEAVKLFASSLDIVKREFGDKHYKYGMFLNSSGLAHAMLNDFKKSYEELKQALQILITCLGPNHTEVADCYANLGDVCMKLVSDCKEKGKLSEAQTYYTKANKIIESSLGATHPKCQQFSSLLFICENYDSLMT